LRTADQQPNWWTLLAVCGATAALGAALQHRVANDLLLVGMGLAAAGAIAAPALIGSA
jgi:hypothetical protein